jgi:hypothetical protein
LHNLSFFYRVNHRKIPEMSSGMEECKIPAWARNYISGKFWVAGKCQKTSGPEGANFLAHIKQSFSLPLNDESGAIQSGWRNTK